MPSMSSRAEETKLLAQKMRILLLKGLTGLYKTFPEENKNHQVSLISHGSTYMYSMPFSAVNSDKYSINYLSLIS